MWMARRECPATRRKIHDGRHGRFEDVVDDGITFQCYEIMIDWDIYCVLEMMSCYYELGWRYVMVMVMVDGVDGGRWTGGV